MKKRQKGKSQGKSASPNAESGANGRGPDGRFLPGNSAALVHGLRSERARNALLPGQEERLAVLAERRSALQEDLGGAAALGVIKQDMAQRFIELEVIADTLAADLVRHGVITAKGKQRAAVTTYLAVVDRLNKLAQTLGLERREKQIPTLDAYLASRDNGGTSDDAPL